MNRRRFAALSAAALAASACSRDRRKTVAVIPKGQAHVFWQSVHAGANSAGQEQQVEILWNGPAVETDYAGQIKIVDAMISRHVDAIALAPIDKRGMVSVVERAMREKIPVVIFDSGIDTDQFVSQVATDNFKAGQVAADRLGEILGGKGKIAMIATQPGGASTMAREEGFESRLKEKYPGLVIADKQYGMSEVAMSLKKAENILTAHPDLAGIFASNESGSVGTAQALKSRGAAAKFVGFDWSPILKDNLESGVIDSLVVQHPFRMGHDAVIAATKAIRGEAVQKVANIEPRLVRKADLSNPEVDAQLNPDLKKWLG